MSTDFNLISELHDKTLVIKTEGYINNIGGGAYKLWEDTWEYLMKRSVKLK